MAGIIVPDWRKRNLQKGFAWQKYFASTIRYVSNAEFSRSWQRQKSRMDTEREAIQDAVKAYAMERCSELGLHLERIQSDCISEPSSKSPMEESIWKARDLAFVWIVWISVLGPVPEKDCKPEMELPLEAFWPSDLCPNGGGVAEIIDASLLTKIEQGIVLPETSGK